jgi:N-acetylglucosaminyl-diphospho-decaprenol L-rhamnosyltransferase
VTAPARSVQVITVSYRSAELVKKSLHALAPERALLAPLGIQLTCFIIDNSQLDHEPIRAEVSAQGWSDWVTVVCAERNGGFAYGNNRGFEFGLAQSAR